MSALNTIEVLLCLVSGLTSVMGVILVFVLKRLIKELDSNTRNIIRLDNEMAVFRLEMGLIKSEIKEYVKKDHLELILSNINLKLENIIQMIHGKDK